MAESSYMLIPGKILTGRWMYLSVWLAIFSGTNLLAFERSKVGRNEIEKDW